MLQILAVRADIRGIAMSGYGAESDIEKSRGAGFFEHLIKPVSFVSLNLALDNLKRDGSR